MRKSYTIQLDSLDLGQLLDGLEMREMVGRLARRGVVVSQRDTTHQRTAELEGRVTRVPDCFPAFGFDWGLAELVPPTECSKPEEADDIAAHYRSIITRIRQQMKAQP